MCLHAHWHTVLKQCRCIQGALAYCSHSECIWQSLWRKEASFAMLAANNKHRSAFNVICLQHLAVALRDSWSPWSYLSQGFASVLNSLCIAIARDYFLLCGLYMIVFWSSFCGIEILYLCGALYGEWVGMGPSHTPNGSTYCQAAQTGPGDSWPQLGSFDDSDRDRGERWNGDPQWEYAARPDQDANPHLS